MVPSATEHRPLIPRAVRIALAGCLAAAGIAATVLLLLYAFCAPML
jgi:hypothetical protein